LYRPREDQRDDRTEEEVGADVVEMEIQEGAAMFKSNVVAVGAQA
jgi:hypothetical protein